MFLRSSWKRPLARHATLAGALADACRNTELSTRYVAALDTRIAAECACCGDLIWERTEVAQ